MLGSQSRGRLPYSSVKLLSDYIKVCDHNIPTLQTDLRRDGQTDRQATNHSNTAQRITWRTSGLTDMDIPAKPLLFKPFVYYRQQIVLYNKSNEQLCQLCLYVCLSQLYENRRAHSDDATVIWHDIKVTTTHQHNVTQSCTQNSR